jgi:hypothetical protein
MIQTNMLRNSYGQFMNHNELFHRLGLKPSGHLPKQGFEQTIEGVKFRCDPAPEPKLVPKAIRHWDNKNQVHRYTTELRPQKRSTHRVKYLCDCGKWIPFGRAFQHNKAKSHQV